MTSVKTEATNVTKMAELSDNYEQKPLCSKNNANGIDNLYGKRTKLENDIELPICELKDKDNPC